jgi:hypothetical protein
MRAALAFAFASLATAIVAACGSSTTCKDAASCAAGTGGADAGSDGGGGQGGGTFPCKQVTCEKGSQACAVTTYLGQNPMGACMALPSACMSASADCSCFGDLMGCNCQKEADGSFAIFCDTGM